MTAQNKSSSLPAPISLTLEEAAQVSGGLSPLVDWTIRGREIMQAMVNNTDLVVSKQGLDVSKTLAGNAVLGM